LQQGVVVGILQMGFYCGLAILYPYGPVYCDKSDCSGTCYGTYLYTAKSAPLPPDATYCEAGPSIDGGDSQKGWFQWKPRTLASHEAGTHATAKECFWEDRGSSMDINDMKRN
jgi:hypothetical protein